jgi:hypothetical protein
MRRQHGPTDRASKGRRRQRLGATTLDYVLIMTALLPVVAMASTPSRRIVALVYELTCVLVASPFM